MQKLRNKSGQFIKGHRNIGKPPIGKHWKLSEKTKKRQSKAKKGSHPKNTFQKGSKHWNWKGGKTRIILSIRASIPYAKWRLKVFERDNWICQSCRKEGHGDLVAHHKIPLAKIIQDKLFDKIWNVDNGITLCEKCHNLLHKGRN